VQIASYSVYWIYTVGHSGRGGGITTYTILEGTTNGTTTTATISNLQSNKAYNLYVRAKDVAGYLSPYSAAVSVTPGAPPSGLSAAEVSPSPGYLTPIAANHDLQVQLSAKSFPAITYSIVSPPGDMTVNSSTGFVDWTPTAANVGTTNVTFVATNTFGSTSITVPITVTPDVPVPSFVFTNTDSPTFNVVGFPIGLQITDASNTPSTYSVVSAPGNVSINQQTGVVNWVPTPDQAGNPNTLTFQLTNSAGTAQISLTPVIYISDAPQNVNVSNLNSLSPVLNWSPPVYNDNLVAGYRVMISGPDFGQDNFTTDASTLSAPLYLWSYPGTYQVNIQAFDALGNQGLWNTSLSFYYAPSLPNPTYAYTSNGGGQYAVVGQQMTIQVTDQNTSLPSTFALTSYPPGMTISSSGLITWTPALTDLGTAYATVAVTNSVGETDLSLSIPVLFASTANNVQASFASGGSAINLNWTDPTFVSEPIAGYDVYLSWIDGDGYTHSSGMVFVAAGSDSFVWQNLPGDAEGYVMTVVAVDSSGNEGAYPLSGTTLYRG
jgi:hypothetical protein